MLIFCAQFWVLLAINTRCGTHPGAPGRVILDGGVEVDVGEGVVADTRVVVASNEAAGGADVVVPHVDQIAHPHV